MYEFGVMLRESLPDAMADLAEGAVRVDIRPSVGTGSFLRLEQGSEELRGSLLPNIYAPRELSGQARRSLREAGWSVEGGHMTARWTSSDVDAAIEGVVGALIAMGADPDNVIVVTEAYEVDELPQVGHAVTMWDWKQPPPYEEFNDACERLLRIGAESVHFNDAQTHADDYGLVISGAPISMSSVEAAWNLYYIEAHEDGCELAVVEPDGHGGFRAVPPRLHEIQRHH